MNKKILTACVLLMSACTMNAQSDLERAKWQIEIGRYTEGAKMLRPLADNGNAEAQYIAAKLFFNGQGVMQSDTQGVKYATMAAKTGRIDALVLLLQHYSASSNPYQGKELLESYLTAFPDSVNALRKVADDDAVRFMISGYRYDKEAHSTDVFEGLEKIYAQNPAMGELVMEVGFDEKELHDLFLKCMEYERNGKVTPACKATLAKLEFMGKGAMQHHQHGMKDARAAAAQNSTMGKYLLQTYAKKRMPGYYFADAVIFNTDKRRNVDQAYSRNPTMLTWKEVLAEERNRKSVWKVPTKEEAKILMQYYLTDHYPGEGRTVTIWTTSLPMSEVYYWQTFDHNGNVIKEEPEHHFLGSHYNGKVLFLPILEVKHKE